MAGTRTSPPDWQKNARLEGFAGVLDPEDTVGAKNRLIDRAQKRAIAHRIGALGGARVLDFGCGVGRLASWLMTKGATVHGVDSSEEMVRQARANVPAGEFDHIGHQFELKDESYDFAFSVGVLGILPADAVGTTLTQLRRALKPDGKLVALEKVSDGTPGRGWTLERYLISLSAAGLELQTLDLVRLGYSSVIAAVVRRPWLSGLPLLPWLLELEAKRHVSKGFADGQYADYLFVSTPRVVPTG